MIESRGSDYSTKQQNGIEDIDRLESRGTPRTRVGPEWTCTGVAALVDPRVRGHTILK